jgi:hypothetical protein
MKSRNQFKANIRLAKCCGAAIAVHKAYSLSVASQDCKRESIDTGACMCGKFKKGRLMPPIQDTWEQFGKPVIYYGMKSKIVSL